MKRRDFLKNASVTTAALAMNGIIPEFGAAQTTSTSPSANAAQLPKRDYGKTGIKLSIIGFGGIVVTDVEQKQADRIVAEAVEQGVNYFDVAPGYGTAEQILGPALEPFRKKVFLACKTGQRSREGAEREMKRSLDRLKTDYFDLYQLHGVTDVKKDIDAAFAKGGAMEVYIEGRKSGRIRHLGFSAHTVEAAYAAMDRFDFDSILFPVNFACFTKGHFGPQIMERAEAKGVARLALKGLARQKWPANDPLRKRFKKPWYQPITDLREAEPALRFTLSQPITAAIPPGDETLFRMALDIARKFKPITPEENETLAKLAATLNPIFPLDKKA